MERAGADLDAGAYLADLGRLLEHGHVEAVAHQRQRGGQATDAATGDDDRQIARCRTHHPPLQCMLTISILMTSVETAG